MIKSLRASRKVCLVGGVLGTLLLAGCGTSTTPTSSASGGPVTVTLWESQANQPVSGAMNAIVSQYNKAHPGQTVQLHLISQGSQILAAIGAHNPPIMGEVNHYIQSLRTTNQLVSFNPYINGSNGMTAAQQSQIYPSIWNDGLVNGQHYRILVDTKVSEFLYNKQIFQQAGITSLPTTYTQLAQDLNIIQQKVPGVTPMALDDSIGDIIPPFLGNGGTLFKPGTTNQVDFTSNPAMSNTFNYFKSLYSKKQMIFGNTNGVRSLFAQGKLAVVDQTSAGTAPTIAGVNGKFPVGAFAWPNGSTGHSGNIIQGEGIVMMAGYSKAQYNTAWSFLNFWLSPKEQAYWAVHSGYAPENKAAAQYITAADYAANPGLKVAIDTMNSQYTMHRPGQDNYSQVESLLAASFFKAVEGQQPVSSSLTALQQQADAALSGKSGL
jgi:sn-glycerol 3-phosphate transport system substrate-binding protein